MADEDDELEQRRKARKAERKRASNRAHRERKTRSHHAADEPKSTGNRCGARKPRGEKKGELCQLPAGFGTEHVGYGLCKYHGGSMPANVKRGARLAMEDRLKNGAGFYGTPVDVTPADALLAEVHRTAGHVAWLQERVAYWEPPDHLKPAERAREIAAVQHLYTQERTRLASVCQIALNAGINAAKVRAAEDYGQAIATLVGGILDGLNLTPEQRQLAPAVVQRQLARITTEAA